MLGNVARAGLLVASSDNAKVLLPEPGMEVR